MLFTGSSLPETLYTAAQVRELDRSAIENYALPGSVLMQRAGAAAYRVLRTRWPRARRVLVLCGAGNNGGDGYQIARYARIDGLDVSVRQVGDHSKPSADSAQAARACAAAGVTPAPFDESAGVDADVVVDALFGAGLDREISGVWRAAIETIGRSGVDILSVDLPSGVCADTGRVLGYAIQAQATVVFVGLKRGLFTGPGVEHGGEIYFDDLDVPAAAYAGVTSTAGRMTFAQQRAALKPRRKYSHKGSYGHALVIGGDEGFIGSACLCAQAAARSGAGLVTLASRHPQAAAACMVAPEIMAHTITQATELRSLLRKATVVAIGPGLGLSKWAAACFSAALESGLPLIVDADALTLLAHEPVHCDRWILTPHPGEAARLLRSDTRSVEADRIAAASEIQRVYGGVAVVKGSGTTLVDQDKNISLCAGGNPGMASGGMGDALTGVLAGLVAQSRALELSLSRVARLGVCLHAEAADRAAVDGERGTLASDLMPWIRRLVNNAV